MWKSILKGRALLVVLLGFSLLIGFWIGRSGFNNSDERTISVRESSSEYKFISPLLFLKTPEEDAFPEYRELKDAMSSFAKDTLDKGEVRNISIYFRNLNTAQWVGVNTDERFAPSSMLKVLIAMGLMREVEKKPSIMTLLVRLPMNVPTTEQVHYAPEEPILPGGTYPVDELLRHLIIQSDNVANFALYKIVGDEKINQIYDDLELPRPGTSDGYTSPEYSRIFRALYNATYISRESSEKLLSLLSETTFTKGLVAGVPEGTVVSHKFGVRTVDVADNTAVELHDCGVVYFPGRPYFICVMTRGEDFSILEKVIQNSSAVVWKEISALK